MVSIVRTSARQDEPIARSWLETVPEPTIVPAASGRVLAACAIRRPKSNCISTPASGWPSSWPLIDERSAPCSLPSRQASPSASGRDRDRRAGAARLALEEAEALGELVRDQAAQRDVVEQHHELDVGERRRRRDAHRHVVGDHRDLGLEVDAVGLVGDLDRVARPEKAVRGALVHQRIVEQLCRQLGAARPAHQRDVVQIGAAVGELVGARQGRRAGAGIEGEDVLGAELAPLQLRRDLAQRRLERRPVVERGLQASARSAAPRPRA